MVVHDETMRTRRTHHGSESISPTAYYTGYVWVHNGLGPGYLATTRGKAYYHAMRPGTALGRMLGGPVLEDVLLARHRLIDRLLSTAIESGRVRGVLELAAGLSPRGLEFARHYGTEITYVETDLPAMAARKYTALRRAGTLGPNHRVESLDVLGGRDQEDFTTVLRHFARGSGLAVVSEGLLNYLSAEAVGELWSRVHAALRPFREGLYLSDLHVSTDRRGPAEAFGARLLGMFVRSGVHFHFTDSTRARAALRATGFDRVTVHHPSDFPGVLTGSPSSADRVRVLAAETR